MNIKVLIMIAILVVLAFGESLLTSFASKKCIDPIYLIISLDIGAFPATDRRRSTFALRWSKAQTIANLCQAHCCHVSCYGTVRYLWFIIIMGQLPLACTLAIRAPEK